MFQPVDVELAPERFGDRRRLRNVGGETRGRMRGDLERGERVGIDERLLERDDVGTVARGPEHRERKPQLRIGEAAHVAAYERGAEGRRPVDDRRDTRLDEAGGAEADAGIGVGLAERRRPERERAPAEPAREVFIGRAAPDERLP